jgi:HEAT repeat protein
LIDALGDVVWSVRRSAAEALGRIGPGAREAVPALQRTQTDTDEHVQEAAKLALEAIALQESGGPSTAGSEAVP